VSVSNDGMDGIIKILENTPDVIILDIMMPQMDGFEVLKTIRDQSSIRIPLIVCSNLSSEADKNKALAF
jgi:CheY-like chemotaxis protein